MQMSSNLNTLLSSPDRFSHLPTYSTWQTFRTGTYVSWDQCSACILWSNLTAVLGTVRTCASRRISERARMAVGHRPTRLDKTYDKLTELHRDESVIHRAQLCKYRGKCAACNSLTVSICPIHRKWILAWCRIVSGFGYGPHRDYFTTVDSWMKCTVLKMYTRVNKCHIFSKQSILPIRWYMLRERWLRLAWELVQRKLCLRIGRTCRWWRGWAYLAKTNAFEVASTINMGNTTEN